MAKTLWCEACGSLLEYKGEAEILSADYGDAQYVAHVERCTFDVWHCPNGHATLYPSCGELPPEDA